MQKHEAHGSSETQITTGGTHQLKALRDLIGNDAFAMSFQSVRQYREALLNAAPAVQGEPVEYQCHSCRKTTPPPAPFKAYVECGECGALTAAPIAVRLAAPQPAEQPPFEWPLLDAPALIGGVVVGKGCSTGTVVAIAKRKHQYEVETSPEEHARREKAFKDMLRQIHEGIGQQPAEQQPDVAQLVEALEEARRELNSCQSVIHYAGGFDPAYVTGAQAALVKIDAALAAYRKGGE